MTRRASAFLAFTFVISSCGSGTTSDGPARVSVSGIGELCVPSDEASQKFQGHSLGELQIDSDDPLRACLVNHFQGRIGCPYGQTAGDLGLAPDDPKRCRTSNGHLVSVVVEPQLAGRSPDESVYVSCRCDGEDPSATYCLCPAGFACTHLIDDLGFGTELAGSYCVRAGTQFDGAASYGPACDRAAAPGDPAHCD